MVAFAFGLLPSWFLEFHDSAEVVGIVFAWCKRWLSAFEEEAPELFRLPVLKGEGLEVDHDRSKALLTI